MNTASGKTKRTNKLSNIKRKRLCVLKSFCIILFVVLFCFVAYYKIFHGEEFDQRTKSQSGAYTDSTVPAKRGAIYAATGECLAYSTFSYDVILDPYVLQEASAEQKASTVDLLCKVLNISDKTAVSRFLEPEYANRRYERLEKGQSISEEQKELLEKYQQEGDVKGIWFEEKEERIYPYNEILAQVLGFGKVYGLDASYDEELTGTVGRRLMVATGEGDYNTQETPAVDGNNLILTVNMSVQKVLEEKMAKYMQKTNALNACAICMNPQTGAIYGWVNYPTFNLNEVTELIGTTDRFMETYADTEDYAQRVWNNMGIHYTYQPGSTFKPVAAAIALEENAVSLKEKFFCGATGYAVPGVDGYTIRCIHNRLHGNETLEQILCNSCNQGMSQVAERISSRTFWSYLNTVGIGRATGIDLPNENTAENLVYTETTMGVAEKAACSFGQGFNLTPIQLMTAFSSVINGGKIIKPYLVSQISNPDGKIVSAHIPETSRTAFSTETSEILRQYLNSCYRTYVNYGMIKESGYASVIGAKTGTAEQGDYSKDAFVVNFESFAPLDDPEVLLLVVMNHTNAQSSDDPVAYSDEVLKEILPILGVYGE